MFHVHNTLFVPGRTNQNSVERSDAGNLPTVFLSVFTWRCWRPKSLRQRQNFTVDVNINTGPSGLVSKTGSDHSLTSTFRVDVDVKKVESSPMWKLPCAETPKIPVLGSAARETGGGMYVFIGGYFDLDTRLLRKSLRRVSGLCARRPDRCRLYTREEWERLRENIYCLASDGGG